jgi:hypothetical protein
LGGTEEVKVPLFKGDLGGSVTGRENGITTGKRRRS